eukprot:TRINITY_DN21467_c0_g1_i2.p1 TRINITY_DN21467_c0_g1~~TRINITY_DN21467_c0_g1_i2.p1  ORF type:complete len:122 (+),score=12.72 TRINITY_DN21467_c0_g1_i2:215-580(+)
MTATLPHTASAEKTATHTYYPTATHTHTTTMTHNPTPSVSHNVSGTPTHTFAHNDSRTITHVTPSTTFLSPDAENTTRFVVFIQITFALDVADIKMKQQQLIGVVVDLISTPLNTLSLIHI